MTAVLTGNDFGDALRSWRGRRGLSQLDLANAAGVSQRHISFLETGRSGPSREMVTHLGLVLDVPLRECNTLLGAAGFSPVYTERSMIDPEMAEIRAALETMLAAHDPFPAYVVDRHWNIVLANDAIGRLLSQLEPEAIALAGNVLRLLLHPDGLRNSVVNWTQLAAAMIRRVDAELTENPSDLELAALLAEVLEYPGLPSEGALSQVPPKHELLIPMTAHLGDVALQLFTAISTLASPNDVTLQELRLETLLPANADTHAHLLALRDRA